jgi:hypothetical protein
MHIVTHEWVEKNATGKASWTREQLKIVGVSWPPQRGWKTRINGIGIPDEAARKFEAIGLAARTKAASKAIQLTW